MSDGRHRIMGASAIVASWLFVVAIGVVVLAVFNPTVPTASIVFEAVSAGSGVGLTKGLTGSTANGATKVVLTMMMLAGRIEMTSFIVLLLRPAVSMHRSGALASADR